MLQTFKGCEILWEDRKYFRWTSNTGTIYVCTWTNRKTVVFFVLFFLFLLDTCPFLGPLIPLFRTSGNIPLGFKTRMGSLIRTWQRHMWYMFPEIQLWCDTFASVNGQHSSWSLSPYVCFSRGRLPDLDLNTRPLAQKSNALTIRPQRPGWKTVFIIFAK